MRRGGERRGADVDLARYVGGTIERVYRLRYDTAGTSGTDLDGGGVEIVFADGSVLYCDTGPDGDSMIIETTRWIDPFADADPGNEAYVRRHGKWARYDVSAEPDFGALIGLKLFDVAPMIGTKGTLYGLLLAVSGYLLAVYNRADELQVTRLA